MRSSIGLKLFLLALAVALHARWTPPAAGATGRDACVEASLAYGSTAANSATVAPAATPALAEEHAAEPSVTDSGTLYNALWAVGIFMALLAVLTKLAWGPVLRAVQQRDKYIADTLAQAEARAAESQQLLDEYRARLAAVDRQAAEELDRARKAADAAREQILSAAREEADAVSKRAAEEVSLARQAALDELRAYAVDLATTAAEKIIRKRLDPADQKRLVEESLQAIRAMPKGY